MDAKYGTKFALSLEDLPEPSQPRLALISGRTGDNPRLLSEAIKHGAKCIYLGSRVRPPSPNWRP